MSLKFTGLVGPVLAVGLVASPFGARSAQAGPFPFEAMYVFGDSLSDISPLTKSGWSDSLAG